MGQLQLRGDTLVTGGSDGSVRVWSLKTFSPIHRLAAHDNSVTSLQFDDSRIVSGGSDGRVKVWDLARGQLVRELGQPAEAVWRVVFEEEKAVVLASRGGKTVMEVWSFAPPEDPLEARRYGTPTASSVSMLVANASDRRAASNSLLEDGSISEPPASPLPLRDESMRGPGPSGLSHQLHGDDDGPHYYDDTGRIEPVASSSSRQEELHEQEYEDELTQEEAMMQDVVMSDEIDGVPKSPVLSNARASAPTAEESASGAVQSSSSVVRAGSFLMD